MIYHLTRTSSRLDATAHQLNVDLGSKRSLVSTYVFIVQHCEVLLMKCVAFLSSFANTALTPGAIYPRMSALHLPAPVHCSE